MLLATLIAINALSALDFVLTRYELQIGAASEGNPVLASLFVRSAGQAWMFKTVVVLAVSVAIWRQRKYRAILGVAIGALVLYILVIAYHTVGLALIANA